MAYSKTLGRFRKEDVGGTTKEILPTEEMR